MAKKKKTDQVIEPKATKAPTFLKKDLEEVANELSTVMKFAEPIPTGKKTTVAILTSDIKEAALELEEHDVISDETLAVLAGLEATLPWDITVDIKEEPEPETDVKEEPKVGVKEMPKAEMPPNLVDEKDEKLSSVKPKEPKKEKKGIGNFVREGLIDGFFKGMKNKEIATLAIEKFKGNTNAGCIGWYKNQLKKKGIKFVI